MRSIIRKPSGRDIASHRSKVPRSRKGALTRACVPQRYLSIRAVRSPQVLPAAFVIGVPLTVDDSDSLSADIGG
eukprot:6929003-Lingulodinium_polyedra.AAC.1